jgi:hypothetical protein
LGLDFFIFTIVLFFKRSIALAKMRLSHLSQALLASAGHANAQFTEGTYTAVVGGTSTNLSLLGNYYN